MKILLVIGIFIINGILLFNILQKKDIAFDYNKYFKNGYLFEEDEKKIYFIEDVAVETEFCNFEVSQIKIFDKELNRIQTAYDPSKNINLTSKVNLSDNIINIETKNNKINCLKYPGFSKIRKIPDGYFFDKNGKYVLLTDNNSALYIFSSDFTDVVYAFKLPQKEIIDVEMEAFSSAHLLTYDSNLKISCVEYWDLYSRLRMAQRCFNNPDKKLKKISYRNNSLFVTDESGDILIPIEDLN